MKLRAMFFSFVSVVALAAACAPIGTAGDAGRSDAAADTVVSPSDASAGDGCATLMASGAPFVSIELTSGTLPMNFSLCYGEVPPATFRAYYYAMPDRSFFRMTGAANVNGRTELVDLTFTAPGNGTSMSGWPLEADPYAPSIVFMDPQIPGGVGPYRRFYPVGPVSTGTINVTRFDAVGSFVEGRLSGVGVIVQVHPTAERYEDVSFVGTFRVRRTADQ